MRAVLAQNAEKVTTLEMELSKRSGEVDKLKEQCSYGRFLKLFIGFLNKNICF